MEDSDHEVHSSSDEQDSCANSPIHSGDHDAEKVQVTSPKNLNSLKPYSEQHTVHLQEKVAICRLIIFKSSCCTSPSSLSRNQFNPGASHVLSQLACLPSASV